MISNIERYKNDLNALLLKGDLLENSIQLECLPKEFTKAVKSSLGDKADDFIKSLPSFTTEYQSWYSEARILIKQLLPDRLVDFIHFYEKPKSRGNLTYENYRIEDYFQNLTVTSGNTGQKIVGPDAAISQFRQQVAILKSLKTRFDSSLYDIRQLVQSDLFDSEIDAAKELNKHKFMRAAGALTGVVLERHLAQVCENHNIKVIKKDPGIADLDNVLKEETIIDIPQWRFIQHLADIRNLCDHDKKIEPTREQVDDLISGVSKVTKTLY
jgi:hypothetical protein